MSGKYKIDKQWFQSRAPAEEGQEIGAGSELPAPAGSADDVIDQFIDRLFGRLTALGHDVTDCDGDDNPAIIIADWMHGRLTDFGDLLREAADSVHASLAETDISDDRRAYRVELERRLRERLQPNAEVTDAGLVAHSNTNAQPGVRVN